MTIYIKKYQLAIILINTGDSVKHTFRGQIYKGHINIFMENNKQNHLQAHTVQTPI